MHQIISKIPFISQILIFRMLFSSHRAERRAGCQMQPVLLARRPALKLVCLGNTESQRWNATRPDLGINTSKHTSEQEHKRPMYKARAPEGGLGKCPNTSLNCGGKCGGGD